MTTPWQPVGGHPTPTPVGTGRWVSTSPHMGTWKGFTFPPAGIGRGHTSPPAPSLPGSRQAGHPLPQPRGDQEVAHCPPHRNREGIPPPLHGSRQGKHPAAMRSALSRGGLIFKATRMPNYPSSFTWDTGVQGRFSVSLCIATGVRVLGRARGPGRLWLCRAP